GWVLVYTSAIMLVLRMFAGGIAHRISPLGLLAACSFLAVVGLFLMSTATGGMILVAATLYGIAKTFFWPTTLAVVADQFPRGGALTMNTVAGVGMLAVGTLGAPFMGNVQDQNIDANLRTQAPALHAQVMEPKSSLFGDYMGINPAAVGALGAAEQQQIAQVSEASQKQALRTIIILPVLMMLFYIALMFYFKGRGGYRPAELGGTAAPQGAHRVATPV
ncbi:MAG: MFS transporter, partial [Gemmatimonadetes bacterium]|nr:MFS transporter [Gemmatimonadota bacterium]